MMDFQFKFRIRTQPKQDHRPDQFYRDLVIAFWAAVAVLPVQYVLSWLV
ncbi:MAG: hypothetical protein NXI18_04800 [Alphaproteobacteria bacterium]|nr:hypothetical protein [Alphaproteobacteria bacterium]